MCVRVLALFVCVVAGAAHAKIEQYAKNLRTSLLQEQGGQPEDPLKIAEATEKGSVKITKASDKLRTDAKEAVEGLEKMQKWRVHSARMLRGLKDVGQKSKARNDALKVAFGIKDPPPAAAGSGSASITIPPPDGLLDTDGYSAKVNRVTSATNVTTTFEYEITHADGSQTIQTVRDTDGVREVVETKELPATAASKAAAKIEIPKPVGMSPGDAWTAKAKTENNATTIVYEIKHADGATTTRTLSISKGGKKTVTEVKTPAPADYVPTPIAAPRELPSGAAWSAKRSIKNTKGVKTVTTTYAINSVAGAYTQIEVKAGDGDVVVTKTKPVAPSRRLVAAAAAITKADIGDHRP